MNYSKFLKKINTLGAVKGFLKTVKNETYLGMPFASINHISMTYKKKIMFHPREYEAQIMGTQLT